MSLMCSNKKCLFLDRRSVISLIERLVESKRKELCCTKHVDILSSRTHAVECVSLLNDVKESKLIGLVQQDKEHA